MNKYKSKIFFDADTGGGEGGGGGEASGDGVIRGTDVFTPSKITTGDRPLPETKKTEPKPVDVTPGSGPSSAPTEAPKPEVGFDAEKFAKTLGTELKPLLDKRDEKPPMTAEEARKLLKTWEPGDDWFTRYDNLDTRKTAVLEMRDALITQADTLAQARMQELISGLRGEIGPQLESVRAYADQQRDERFVKAYPQLGKPELRPLVMAIADDLAKKGSKFQSESEAFTALATGVEAVMKANNPDFKLESPGSTQEDKNKGQNQNQIPTITPGAGGGTGRSSGAPPQPLKRGLAVFGK
ncbi:MAG TPA: hypothetical protein VFQ43_14595 [Nitrososphaera sp.]|nr:hypothetical protein [Nitrososphaera sp.]